MNDYVPMSDAMLAAKKSNDPNAICRLLEQGEDPNAEDEERFPLLSWAAFRGYTEVVRLLLDKGASVNMRGSEGDTPLLHAAFKGHTDIIRLLIKHGADVNLAERGGATPLMYAQWRNHKEGASLLSAAGALEDISETFEEKQRERQERKDYACDLRLVRQEFLSRLENQTAARQWVGAWANVVGRGSGAWVMHADGTVMCCAYGIMTEAAHIEDPGDGTLFYKVLNGKTTKIEKWSVSKGGKRLMFNYGSLVVTFRRLQL